MTNSIKSALGAALVATGLATPALADWGAVGITNFAPAPLVVKSNGQSYTVLANKGMTNISVHVYFDTGTAGRVKSWKTWPIVKTGYGGSSSIGDLKSYAIGKSYGIGKRPKIVDRHEVFSVPAHLFEAKAVQMCNQLANSLRAGGKSNKQIFSANREVEFKVSANYEFDSNGAGSNNPIFEARLPHTAKVRCAKWQGASFPSAGNFANKLHVKAAAMKLKELALMNGTCAVKLTTAISTNTAGATIKYRYVHSSGKKSNVFTTKTAANKIAVVTHTWDVPNKAGTERGWMKLEGVNNDFQSNSRRYVMDCKKAPGGFAPNPGKPKVRIKLGGRNKLKN